MQEQLLSERRDGVLFLTFSNPAAKNALGPALYDAVSEALAQAAGDNAVHCVILGGAGGVFSAGATCSGCWPTGQRTARFRRIASTG